MPLWLTLCALHAKLRWCATAAVRHHGCFRTICLLACREPRGLGFVEFQDERDAADAVRGLDGMVLGGREV
jgi:hypothetical protein